jgi:hypothetical protein
MLFKQAARVHAYDIPQRACMNLWDYIPQWKNLIVHAYTVYKGSFIEEEFELAESAIPNGNYMGDYDLWSIKQFRMTRTMPQNLILNMQWSIKQGLIKV